MLLSTLILSTVSFLQKVSFQYIYFILAIYLVLIWGSYIIWLWNDSKKRFTNEGLRVLIWIIASATFIFGLLLYILIRPQQLDDDSYWVSLERKFLLHETYGMGECDSCGFMLRPEFMNCPACGKVLREKCKKCEQVVDVTWKRCAFCGAVRIKEKENPVMKKEKKEDISIWVYGEYEAFLGFTKSIGLYINGFFKSISKYVSQKVERLDELVSKDEEVSVRNVQPIKSKPKGKKKELPHDEKVALKHVKSLLFSEEKVPVTKKHS